MSLRTVCSRGFTLVELLIAATMFAILAIGLGGHLRGGLTVWRRTEALMDRLQRQRVAFDRLGRELANAVVYDGRAEAYGEEPGTLPRPRFEPDVLAWFTVTRPSAGAPAGIRRVSYACGVRDGVAGFYRRSQTIGEARRRVDAEPERALEGCERLRLRFGVLAGEGAAPVEWRERWDPPETSLPRLVEVTTEMADGERVSRVFLVPAGRGN